MKFKEVEGLKVEVEKVVYVPQLEAPPEKPFPFAYFIHIINESDKTVTIMARKWILTDTEGDVVVVEGSGVVGETPQLAPGDKFSYNSYHVISSSSEVSGAFFGVSGKGEGVLVKIPPFILRCPPEAK